MAKGYNPERALLDELNSPEARVHRLSLSQGYENYTQEELRAEAERQIAEEKNKEKANNLVWDFNLKIETVEDHAEVILDKNPLFYDSENKDWYKWDLNNKVWVKTTQEQIISFIKQVYNTAGLSESRNRSKLLNSLMDKTQEEKYVPKEPKNTWLQIDKTVYDIETGESFPSTPAYFFRNRIPHKMGTGEEFPTLQKWFKDWQDDNDQCLYDIASYILSPCSFLEVVFFFTGRGADGKGKFVNFLERLLGEGNHTKQDLEKLTDKRGRFQTNVLKNTFLCFLGDNDYGVLRNTGSLKEQSGGTDSISAEVKGGNHYTFKSFSKILGTFNTLPETIDKTDGFYRRTYVLTFNKSFSIKNRIEINDVPEWEFENILNYLLRRLKEIYKERYITGWGETVRERRERYENLSNPVKRFLEDEMVPDIRGLATASKLYNRFIKYAERSGFNKFGFDEFIKRLQSQPDIEKKRRNVYVTEDGFVFGSYDEVPSDKVLSGDDRQKLTVYSGYAFKEVKKPASSKADGATSEEKVLTVDSDIIKTYISNGFNKYDYILHILEPLGVSENELESHIKKLKRSGAIYENEPGVYYVLE